MKSRTGRVVFTSAIAMTLVTVAFASGTQFTSSRDEPSIRGCPRPNWPGPWTACEEARWVERVAQAGGYKVASPRGTGSALIAQGRGRSFYIWAASTGADDSTPDDDGVRTSWSAQEFTFWVEAGPTKTSMKPTFQELGSVIAASRQIRPPPAFP
jgi:hypothetical protein